MKIIDYQSLIYNSTVMNVRWTFELSHCLLSSKTSTEKDVEMFWSKVCKISKIIVDEEIFG